MEKEICRNCLHYNALYMLRDCSFENLHYGICKVDKKERKRGENCEKFHSDVMREKRRTVSLCCSLQSAAKSIDTIAQILQEKEKELYYK